MKKIYLVCSIIFFSLLFSTSAFADNITGSTHEEGLRYLIEKGAIQSDSSGHYYPNATVTRGQFASYISIALDLPTSTTVTFSDVIGSTKQDQAIRSAAAAGIISGYPEGTFRPNDYVTRQHMARMLQRTLQYLKIDTSNVQFELNFADAHKIYAEHQQAVGIGSSLGIIKGEPLVDGVYFKPLHNATVGHAATFIYRLMTLVNDPLTKPEPEQPVTPPTTPNPVPPTPAPDVEEDFGDFSVFNIQNYKLAKVRSYTTFEKAVASIQNSRQIVLDKNARVIYMKSGVVLANKYVEIRLTGTGEMIGAAQGSQMEYMSSNGSTVTVSFAGQIGTLPINSNISLEPTDLIKERDHYTVNNNGEVVHNLVANLRTGGVTSSYIVGKAPAQMKKGEKYYSWNGIYFTNKDKSVGFDYYNYYQFLPAFSKTKYTAAELDSYLLKRLKELESTGASAFKNASTKSKIIGLGTIAKQMEARYGVNALMVIALSFNESNYGMSTKAQNFNNLFGLNVRDTGDQNDRFDDVEHSVRELLTAYWLPNYIEPGGKFANGSVFGSKAMGFNVKYASDPYWGAKAAGHYYRIDKALGRKDASNSYTIGLTRKIAPVNSIATINSGSVLYNYKRANYPVIIQSNVNSNFYEIISDKRTNNRVVSGFVPVDYVRIIETTK